MKAILINNDSQVDWTKTNQLLISTFGRVILTLQHEGRDPSQFTGVIVYSVDKDEIGISSGFIKSNYKPFNGSVTLQND